MSNPKAHYGGVAPFRPTSTLDFRGPSPFRSRASKRLLGATMTIVLGGAFLTAAAHAHADSLPQGFGDKLVIPGSPTAGGLSLGTPSDRGGDPTTSGVGDAWTGGDVSAPADASPRQLPAQWMPAARQSGPESNCYFGDPRTGSSCNLSDPLDPHLNQCDPVPGLDTTCDPMTPNDPQRPVIVNDPISMQNTSQPIAVNDPARNTSVSATLASIRAQVAALAHDAPQAEQDALTALNDAEQAIADADQAGQDSQQLAEGGHGTGAHRDNTAELLAQSEQAAADAASNAQQDAANSHDDVDQAHAASELGAFGDLGQGEDVQSELDTMLALHEQGGADHATAAADHAQAGFAHTQALAAHGQFQNISRSSEAPGKPGHTSSSRTSQG